MTRYMLDTNIVSELIRHPTGKVTDHIASVGYDTVCVSIVTAAELRYGALKKGSLKLIARVEAVLARLPIQSLETPADVEYGGIRAELEAAGRLIGPNDLLLAAHARAIGATMVTANVAEFSRVRDLNIENWLA